MVTSNSGRRPASRRTATSKTASSSAKRVAPKKPDLTGKAKSVPGSKGSFTAQMRSAGQATGHLKKAEPKKVKQPETIMELAHSIGVANGHANSFILDVPWEERSLATTLGATWNSYLHEFIYVGNMLPEPLKKYISEDYSLSRWIEDEINGKIRKPTIAAGTVAMTPRKHQIVSAKAILKAHESGWRGFVNADGTGLGKTLATLAGVSVAAGKRGFTPQRRAKVLIVCPNVVVPHWQNVIRASRIGNLRVMVINYEKLKKLLSVPASAATAKTVRTKNKRVASQGQSVIKWDYVISDEAHKLKNPDSQRTQAFNTVARYNDPPEKAPFTVWCSATIGQDPVELAYLAPLIAQAVKQPTLNSKKWGEWLDKNGFHVVEQKVGYSWIQPTKKDAPGRVRDIRLQQKEDIDRLRGMLFNPNAPSMRRLPEDLEGWPSIIRSDIGVKLSLADKLSYEKLWKQFRKEMLLVQRGKDPKGSLAVQLRFRQKASLLRVNQTVEFIADLLENKIQVAVSVEFLESVDAIASGLRKLGVTVTEYSGRNASSREGERLRFQRGESQVILFTPVEGFSLHAEEDLPGGGKATSIQRATVVHDVRYTAKSCVQLEGRAHRDGKSSTAYYMYANGTVEEKILRVMLKRMATMKSLSGDSNDSIEEIEELLLSSP